MSKDTKDDKLAPSTTGAAPSPTPTEAKTGPVNTKAAPERKINKISKPDVENVSLRDMDESAKGKDGKYRGNTKTEQGLKEAAEKRAAEAKLGKNVTVRTVSGGRMFYFDADQWITGKPTVVPSSAWLDLQIEYKKIEKAD